MSKADIIFKAMCEDVINNGTDTRGQKVRPIWKDTGESAYTIKQFGVCNKYDLREEFPAITFRKTAIKSAMQEILWIYQMKSNNINDLKLHIWDDWADENGSIGKAYGYQIGLPYYHHKMKMIDPETDRAECDKILMEYPSASFTVVNQVRHVKLDQMDAVLYDLKTAPYGRRIMTNTFNFQDLHEMGLQPCAYSCTFNVTDEHADKLVLNMILNQRSQDILAANNWNTVQYAILLMMVAQVVDMIPGKLVHMIADTHIYDRHVDVVKELVSRPMYDAPKVTLDPDIKDFYKFTKDSIIIENYQAGPQVENIPIAV